MLGKGKERAKGLDATTRSTRQMKLDSKETLQEEHTRPTTRSEAVNHNELVNFIYSVADLIRDTFKRGKYQDVILPFTVLRRLDCVLAPTKEKVLKTHQQLKRKLENVAPQLQKISGHAFYNTSPYDFDRLLADPPNLANNLRNYINGFSENMREVVDRFDFDNTISKLDEAGLLFLVMERFKNIDLHPARISNLNMGYVFEELIRRFNEALNENPGEHFTPREVISLMVNLLLAQDREVLCKNHIVRTVYDPCCGTGGMLTIAKERILEINPNADVHLFGQEVNPETYAVCKSDLYMKSSDGRDAENIAYGSTLSQNKHPNRYFDYLLANPPYGKDWNRDREEVIKEYEQGESGRYHAGVPRINDGQLLFLQDMLSRMKIPSKGGSRVAIVTNGSPLFNGDAESGESEIRRWIIENDWLEAIIALPEQIFYNTGITTFIWVLTNKKDEKRKDRIQLINAAEFWIPLRRNLGDKNREISSEQIKKITKMFLAFLDDENSKIFRSADFGYRKIRVERPLRLSFRVSAEGIARLSKDRRFKTLEVNDRNRIIALLGLVDNRRIDDRNKFEELLSSAEELAGIRLEAPIRKAIIESLSESDKNAEICLDKKGDPEPDPRLRDYEYVPLNEDVFEYFAREVKPDAPDSWIDDSFNDSKDGKPGKVGYEVNFNRHFYAYEPPRQLTEVESDIKALEQEIASILTPVGK
jgi:type I restriction enzyme M protein